MESLKSLKCRKIRKTKLSPTWKSQIVIRLHGQARVAETSRRWRWYDAVEGKRMSPCSLAKIILTPVIHHVRWRRKKKVIVAKNVLQARKSYRAWRRNTRLKKDTDESSWVRSRLVRDLQVCVYPSCSPCQVRIVESQKSVVILLAWVSNNYRVYYQMTWLGMAWQKTHSLHTHHHYTRTSIFLFSYGSSLIGRCVTSVTTRCQ